MELDSIRYSAQCARDALFESETTNAEALRLSLAVALRLIEDLVGYIEMNRRSSNESKAKGAR